jgi:hypothetical protein
MKDGPDLQPLIDALSQLFPSDKEEDLAEDGKQKKITIVSVQKGKGMKIPKAGKKDAKKEELEEDAE